MKNEINNKREIILNYIKNNPSATYKDLRKNIKLHPERIFKGGMAEIYREAGINSPRTFERNSDEKNKQIIIDYIKKHPGVGLQTILKETKRNPSNHFKNIKEAYEIAGVFYPRSESYKKSPGEKRNEIIKLIRKNPEMTIPELEKKTKIRSIYRLFKNFKDAYEKAGVKKITSGEKIRNRKIKDVIVYIKNNQLAT